MYTIFDKQALNDAVKLMVIEAPHVARKASVGQFVIVRIDDWGERVPLTIADFDRKAGTVTIIFQEVGKSTKQSRRPPIQEINSPRLQGLWDIRQRLKRYGTVICVAGV